MPAPSPMTNPSRSASKGLDALSGSWLRVDRARMAQNPAKASGTKAASVPPVIMTSASPNWRIRKASPMALAPEAQAVTRVVLGPRNPNWMAVWPAAMLAIIMGTKNGLTRPGPRSSRTWNCSTRVSIPPMPEPSTTPTCSGSRSAGSSRADSSAIRAPATANWVNRSMRRASLRSMKSVGSKSRTSAPIWVGKGDGSKRWIRRTAERPLTSPSHRASTPTPKGVTAPMPVMTTRCLPSGLRSTSILRDPLPDVLHRVADGDDALRVLVGDLHVVFLFKGHDQLDEIQGIGAQVVEKRRLQRDLVLFEAEFLGDQLPHGLKDSILAHVMDPPQQDQAVMVRPPSTTSVWPVT